MPKEKITLKINGIPIEQKDPKLIEKERERDQIRTWILEHIPIQVDATCSLDIGKMNDDWDILESDAQIIDYSYIDCNICQKSFDFTKDGKPPITEIITHAKEHIAKNEM